MICIWLLLSIVVSPYINLEGGLWQCTGYDTGWRYIRVSERIGNGNVGVLLSEDYLYLITFAGASVWQYVDYGDTLVREYSFAYGSRAGARYKGGAVYVGAERYPGVGFTVWYIGLKYLAELLGADASVGSEVGYNFCGHAWWGMYSYTSYSIYGSLGYRFQWVLPYVFGRLEWWSVENGFSAECGVGISASLGAKPEATPTSGLLMYNRFESVDKPNIYLYPTEACDVEVRLKLANGEVVCSDPPYTSLWKVRAYPDGRIEGTPGYLFYEARVRLSEVGDRGWCVCKDEVMDFFSSVLKMYGFNEREREDFVEYWGEHLPSANFYVIYPLVDDTVNRLCGLEVYPQPESVMRVWFAVECSESAVEIVPPKVHSFNRQGFSVVEWGVILLD